MNETQRYRNFEAHLLRLQKTAYPEEGTNQHSFFTRKAIENFVVPNRGEIQSVLDVGCGQGPALEIFRDLGLNAVGVTIDNEDLGICREKGFQVERQDMSFLDFPDASFDLVWARHCIEHSPMPLITLFEFERVTRPGGYLYLEVPQDDSIHIDNPNHYAVLSDRGWQSLLRRTEFTLRHRIQFTVALNGWVDIYWCYWLKRRDA